MGASCSTDAGAAALIFAQTPYKPAMYQQPQLADGQQQCSPAAQQQRQLYLQLQRGLIPTLPLSEVTAGQLISLRGRGGLFNDSPLLDPGWLCGVMSEAEWQADVTSVNAASLAAADSHYLATLDTSAAGLRLPAILSAGIECIAFTTGEKGSGGTAQRVFLWYEAGEQGHTFCWNDSGPIKRKMAGHYLNRSDMSKVMVGKKSVPLQSSVASAFPATVCFCIVNRSQHAVLSVAVESSAVQAAWLSAVRALTPIYVKRRGQQTRAAALASQRQREAATQQRQLEAATSRVQQLNAQYEQANRGEHVKWFFQRLQQEGNGPAAVGPCQLLLRCRVLKNNDAPPPYSQAVEHAGAAHFEPPVKTKRHGPTG